MRPNDTTGPSEGPFVMLRVVRDLPYPVDAAYAWLTDYTDEDGELTDAVVEHRPVRERQEDRIVLEGTNRILGRRASGTAEVRLHPPDRWVCTIVRGPGRGSVYEYALTPREGGGSRLTVTYRVRARRWRARLQLTLMKPFIRRELVRMWEGFEASMARDLATEKSRAL